MAKWRRGGGGRRGRWVIEWVERQENGQWSTVNGQLSTEEGRGARGEEEAPAEPDPFTFDTPEAIRAALWRFEQRKMLAEESCYNRRGATV